MEATFKHCVCGAQFHRPAKYADAQWSARRFCSRGCARPKKFASHQEKLASYRSADRASHNQKRREWHAANLEKSREIKRRWYHKSQNLKESFYG
jgi:hypothetical protein